MGEKGCESLLLHQSTWFTGHVNTAFVEVPNSFRNLNSMLASSFLGSAAHVL